MAAAFPLRAQRCGWSPRYEPELVGGHRALAEVMPSRSQDMRMRAASLAGNSSARRRDILCTVKITPAPDAFYIETHEMALSV
jgi:hypothetical protein